MCLRHICKEVTFFKPMHSTMPLHCIYMAWGLDGDLLKYRVSLSILTVGYINIWLDRKCDEKTGLTLHTSPALVPSEQGVPYIISYLLCSLFSWEYRLLLLVLKPLVPVFWSSALEKKGSSVHPPEWRTGLPSPEEVTYLRCCAWTVRWV